MADLAQSETQQTQSASWQGTAAEDLVDGQNTLTIIVQQLTPGLQGTFGAGKETAEVSSVNQHGTTEKANVQTTNAITATWVGQSNRKYPPFVRKGEQVVVTKVGDTDKYYWDSQGRDPDLRQTERYRLEIGATTDTKAAKTEDNTYFLEMDSIAQKVFIRTSKANGEKVTWGLLLDAKNGIACLQNDKNDMFYIDTDQKQVQMSNSSGCAIQIMDKTINIVAIEAINFKAGQQTTFDAPQLTYQTSKGGGVTQMNVKSLAINATDGVTIGGPTVGIQGATKLAGPVTAGALRAEGFSTGAVGGAYAAASTDVASGTAASPKNPPDTAQPGGAMRHAAAHEQLVDICQKIEAAFDEINGKIGVPNGYSGVLTALARQAKMAKNQGE